jgi:hypothetical protein
MVVTSDSIDGKLFGLDFEFNEPSQLRAPAQVPDPARIFPESQIPDRESRIDISKEYLLNKKHKYIAFTCGQNYNLPDCEGGKWLTLRLPKAKASELATFLRKVVDTMTTCENEATLVGSSTDQSGASKQMATNSSYSTRDYKIYELGFDFQEIDAFERGDDATSFISISREATADYITVDIAHNIRDSEDYGTDNSMMLSIPRDKSHQFAQYLRQVADMLDE